MMIVTLLMLVGCPSQAPQVITKTVTITEDCQGTDCTPTTGNTTDTDTPPDDTGLNTDTDTDTDPPFGGTDTNPNTDLCDANLSAEPATCPFRTLTCGDDVEVAIGALTDFYDKAFWTDIQIDFSEPTLDQGEAVFFIDPQGATTMRVEIESCVPRYSRIIRSTSCDATDTSRTGDFFQLGDDEFNEYVEEIVQNVNGYEIVIESLGNAPANSRIKVICY